MARWPAGTSRLDEIAALLASEPNGLTSTEIAGRMGMAPYSVSSLVSKAAMYGRIDRVKVAGNVSRWKAKLHG